MWLYKIPIQAASKEALAPYGSRLQVSLGDLQDFSLGVNKESLLKGNPVKLQILSEGFAHELSTALSWSLVPPTLLPSDAPVVKYVPHKLFPLT